GPTRRSCVPLPLCACICWASVAESTALDDGLPLSRSSRRRRGRRQLHLPGGGQMSITRTHQRTRVRGARGTVLTAAGLGLLLLTVGCDTGGTPQDPPTDDPGGDPGEEPSDDPSGSPAELAEDRKSVV